MSNFHGFLFSIDSKYVLVIIAVEMELQWFHTICTSSSRENLNSKTLCFGRIDPIIYSFSIQKLLPQHKSFHLLILLFDWIRLIILVQVDTCPVVTKNISVRVCSGVEISISSYQRAKLHFYDLTSMRGRWSGKSAIQFVRTQITISYINHVRVPVLIKFHY